MTKTLFYSFATVVLLAGLALMSTWFQPQQALGSVIQGNEYMSTSTAASSIFGARTAASLNVRGNTLPVSGSLAQVVITGPTTGILNFYDATTTNINLRGGVATSTILLASFPASAPAGTYTFDVEYKTGLTYDLAGGTLPTTTISYR